MESKYDDLKYETVHNESVVNNQNNIELPLLEINDHKINESYINNLHNNSNLTSLKDLNNRDSNEFDIKEYCAYDENIYLDALNENIPPFSKQVSKVSRNSYCKSNSGIFDLCNHDLFEDDF